MMMNAAQPNFTLADVPSPVPMECPEVRVNLEPRYLREKSATAMFGIGRSKLYHLAKAGKITSITLQEEGRSRGTRLFCVKSIERYIQSFAK